MATMTRKEYAQMFGPTTGDCVRLGDTALLAEVEFDHAVPGDECMTGGGKTVRDGMALSPRENAAGALDLVFENALVIDPVIGIVKGDIASRTESSSASARPATRPPWTASTSVW